MSSKQKQKPTSQSCSHNTKRQIEILGHLRKNARKKLSEIGKEIELSVSTVHEHFHKAKKNVVQYTSLINFEKLGYPYRTFIIFEKSKINAINTSKLKHINNIFKYDKGFAIECISKSIEECENIHLFCQDIQNTQSFNMIEVVCQEKWEAEFFTIHSQNSPKKNK